MNRSAALPLLALFVPVSAHALRLTDLGPYVVDAEASVSVGFDAEPDNILECDFLLGPDPGISLRWDADRDGAWDTGWVDEASFVFSAAGLDGPVTVSIPVQARCFRYELLQLSFVEQTAAGTLEVEVRNVAPLINDLGVVGIDPNLLVEGATYDFTTGGSDVEAADVLTATWTWSDGAVVVGDPASRRFDDGDFSAAIVVADDDGGTATASFSVTVSNVPPTLQPLSLPLDAMEGTPTRLSAVVTDPFDVPQVTWTVDGRTLLGVDVDVTFADDGSYPVLVEADDGDAVVSATGTLVVANVAPDVRLTGDVDDIASPTLAWTAVATDPGDDLLTYDWDFGDGTLLPDGGPSASHEFATNSVYTVAVTVSDGDGGVTRDELSVRITRFGPRITTFDVPSAVDEGQVAVLTCEGIDQAGTGSLSTRWDFGDGSSASTGLTTHAWADDGEREVSCALTDGLGQTDVLVATVAVSNVAPTLAGSPPLTGREGDAYVFQPVANDPGADTLRFSGTGPAGAAIAPTTGRVTWTPGLGQTGDHDFLLEVTDDDGGQDSLRWTVTVAMRDEDQDGMSDLWERDNGLDPGDPADASGDPDSDGRTNLDEFQGGTDPRTDDRPDAPELLSPGVALGVGVVPTATPVLSLRAATSPLGEALVYDVEVYLDVVPRQLVASATGLQEPDGGQGAVWTVDVPLDENGLHVWTARASDGFGEGPFAPAQRFRVDATPEPPSAVQLTWPRDGATVDPGSVLLAWTPAVDPEAQMVTYVPFLFEDGQAPSALPDTTDTRAPALADGDGVTWCWYVEARDPGGMASTSTTSCFLVDPSNLAPSAPTLLAPELDEVVTEAAPEIRVADGIDPEGRATWQVFELDTRETFDGPDLQQAEVRSAGGESSWVPETLREDTWHHLRVLTTDGAADSAWTQGRFLVNVANDPPGAPILRSPIDEAEIFGRVELVADGIVDPEGLATTAQLLVRDGERVIAGSPALDVVDGTVRWVVRDLPTGVYSWTAFATDLEGLDGPEAPPRTLRVPDPADLQNSRELPERVDTPDALTGCGCAAGVGGRRALLFLWLLPLWLRRRR